MSAVLRTQTAPCVRTSNVYVAGAIRGDRSRAAVIRAFIEHIQSLGFTVLSEHLAAEHPNEALAAVIGVPYKDLTVEQIEKQDINWLDQAAYVIAEVSGASTGTGREVEYARLKHTFGKTPAAILCLYQTSVEENVSAMIRGMTPDRYQNVTVRPYASIEEAKDVIKAFLKT